MEFKEIKELFESAGYEPRSYSGRGMFGRNCFGVEVEDPNSVIPDIIMAYARDKADDGYMVHINVIEEILELLVRPHTDSMGRDVILYWPRIKWEEDEDEDEVDDSVSVHSPVQYR